MSIVSIIVPIYNVEEYVEKCINSLTNQTFRDIEVWAISDGSPDHSMEIVDRLAMNDSRIKSIRKENGGYGSVLEYAIAYITSKYFIICDPDDWLEDEAVEILYKAAEEHNVDFVAGCKYIAYKNRDIREIDYIYSPNHKIEESKKYVQLEEFIYMGVSPHAKLYRTEYSRGIKFPHKVSHTDNTLFYLYFTQIKSALYLKKPLANHLVDRPGNTRGQLDSFTQKSFEQNMIVFNSIFEQLDKNSDLYFVICERLFEIMIILLGKVMNSDLEKKNCGIVVSFIEKLKPYKKEMRRHISGRSKLKKMLKHLGYELSYHSISQNLGISLLIKKLFLL